MASLISRKPTAMPILRSDGMRLNSNNISFMSSLWAIKHDSLEEKVQILWNGILNTWFPPTQPYRIGIKAAVLTSDAIPDGVVFEIRYQKFPRSSAQLWERQIFMLECKRASEDTPAGWQRAEHQLLRYLEANINAESCSGMYGACAIGPKVVFYEWDRNQHQLIAMSATIDMGQATTRPVVEDYLDHVKLHGWQRAG